MLMQQVVETGKDPYHVSGIVIIRRTACCCRQLLRFQAHILLYHIDNQSIKSIICKNESLYYTQLSFAKYNP